MIYSFENTKEAARPHAIREISGGGDNYTTLSVDQTNSIGNLKGLNRLLINLIIIKE